QGRRWNRSGFMGGQRDRPEAWWSFDASEPNQRSAPGNTLFFLSSGQGKGRVQLGPQASNRGILISTLPDLAGTPNRSRHLPLRPISSRSKGSFARGKRRGLAPGTPAPPPFSWK